MAFQEKKEKIGEVTVGALKIASPKGLSDILSSLSSSKASTTAILEAVLGGSLGLKASDIHFEPGKSSIKIRVRIDGVLYDAGGVNKEEYKFLLSRIKLLGGIKFNINEVAQDGRFTVTGKEDGRNIEIRVSINPSEYGETAVLRILDPSAFILDIDKLGLREDDRIKIEKTLKKPNGMILVTGPTGSGKTTTLYAFVRKLSSPEIKIITIEDPIEYHLDGIQQTQVDPAAGYDFKNGLRSILRQDPDVILVGEIRDSETAGIAIQAALTGHIVFSTLHTNTSSGAIPRLMDLEVKPQLIGPSVNVIIAERLVRKLCPSCRRKKPLDEDFRAGIEKFLSGLPKEVKKPDISEIAVYEAVGCSLCSGGYKGRLGIFEVLEMDKDVEILVHKELSEAEIERYLKTRGFVNIQQDGIIKVLEGVVDFAEVEKNTGPINW